MIKSPFKRLTTWLIAALLFTLVMLIMYANIGILNLRYIFNYVLVAMIVTGFYLIIAYQIYKYQITKEENRKRVEYIKELYPNSYEAFLEDNNLKNVYSDDKVASVENAVWERMEREYETLCRKVDNIINESNRGFELWASKKKIDISQALDRKTKIFIAEHEREIEKKDREIRSKEWENEQDKFSNHCWDLYEEIIPSFGCYSYIVNYPAVNFGIETVMPVVVRQLFAGSFCRDKSINYCNYEDYLKCAEIVENHLEFDKDEYCVQISKYINRLNSEEKVSVLINLKKGWKKTFTDSFVKSIKSNLDSDIIRHTTVNRYDYKSVDIIKTLVESGKKLRRRLVIVDLATEKDELIKICELIAHVESTTSPVIVYISMLKEYSSDEMKEIIEKDVQEKLAKNIEEEKKIEQLKKMSLDEIPIKEHIEQTTEIDLDKYEIGIPIIETEEIRVNYELPKCNDKDTYCFYTAPDKYSIVFPYRNHRVERRGYTESKFENRLRQEFSSDNNYEILGDVSILVTEGYHPYEPDIAIIEKDNKYGIRIDIEIDEPYSGYENKPIHYIHCGDESRDRTLADLGWLVIRFSESQIFKEPYNCINYIRQLINQIDNTVLPLAKGDTPQKVKRWTLTESIAMIESRYREALLNHEFGIQEIEVEKEKGTRYLTQSVHEKQIAGKVEPIINESYEQNDSFKESKKEVVINKTQIEQSAQYVSENINSVKEVGFIDLGLSVKWATCNLGAEKPEDFGNYYAWGEIVPKRSYNWGSYKYLVGATSVFNKYNNNDKFGDIDNRITLLADDDVAHVSLGGQCRIPTKKELLELMAECTWEKSTINGVDGYKITSKKAGFEDRSIFMPAVGCCDNNYLINTGTNGYYWFSTLYENNPTLAYILRFDSDNVKWSYSSRRKGLSIRPVCP